MATALATGSFWLAAFERAIKTFAQALAALLVADGTGLLNTAWGDRASVAAMAAVVSLLTSIGSDVVTTQPGPSLTTHEVVKE